MSDPFHIETRRHGVTPAVDLLRLISEEADRIATREGVSGVFESSYGYDEREGYTWYRRVYRHPIRRRDEKCPALCGLP